MKLNQRNRYRKGEKRWIREKDTQKIVEINRYQANFYAWKEDDEEIRKKTHQNRINDLLKRKKRDGGENGVLIIKNDKIAEKGPDLK